MNSNTHSIYGTIEYNVWKQLYVHKMNKKTKEHQFYFQPNYEILFKNNKETPYIIRNKKRKKAIKSHYGYYTLAKDGINTTYSETHIAVASAFPHITPEETVDHINDDPTDNRIINLMWMKRSENCRKGQKNLLKIVIQVEEDVVNMLLYENLNVQTKVIVINLFLLEYFVV